MLITEAQAWEEARARRVSGEVQRVLKVNVEANTIRSKSQVCHQMWDVAMREGSLGSRRPCAPRWGSRDYRHRAHPASASRASPILGTSAILS